MVKRRTMVIAGGALLAAAAVASVPLLRTRGPGEAVSRRAYDWSVSGLRSGGTSGIPAELPAPAFRADPQCIVTANKTIGPCHTNDVPIRLDVTEGATGLPMRVSLRLVDAGNCDPIEGADVEIWHADVRGVYSGRAEAMCNPDDEVARSAAFLRGRQITDANGVASFLTVYPGWYSSRAPHIHMRILVGGQELLISQLLFDDNLNDLIYHGHPEYLARPQRDTMNGGDTVFSASEVESFIFDVDRLDGGILQACFTIGVAGRTADVPWKSMRG
ncbi:protocatechuate 3,4-dioxygenase [Mesorhizobium sp. SB112]|uniref:dioxygenase family protein n=1 Tax=Mesorhizobium sp. SB112 TaxID=3151853 RepID=UPI003266F401